MEDQQAESVSKEPKAQTHEEWLASLELEQLAEIVIDLEEQKAAIQDTIDEMQAAMLPKIPWKEQYVHTVPDPMGGELDMSVTFSHRRRETLKYSEKGMLKRLDELKAKDRFAVEKLDKKQFNAWFKGQTDQFLRDAVRDIIRIEHSDHIHRDCLKDLVKARGMGK